MSACTGPGCNCGCCEGTSGLTPVFLTNRPGLSALAYRAGTHARFKEMMLAELSTKPALGKLTTREDDDPTIALLDAWAVTLDVLTFYQERIANEGYLRTATERRSLLELARTIGYELRPGVAASTCLAFTLDGSPGSPREVAIPAGTRAQSLPTKTELPQSFETGEPLLARPEWNALRPRQTRPQTIRQGLEEILIAGIATRLQPGDAILLVGKHREEFFGSERWDLRTVLEVETRPQEGVTRVSWEPGLGHDAPTVLPEDEPSLFALRQRAALFGYNAPDWRALPESIKEAYANKTIPSNWPGFEIQTVAKRQIDLDAVYPRIVAGSWVALAKPGSTELYRVVQAETASRTDFTLTAKTTRLELDTAEHLSWFGLRETVVLGQSEELALAEERIAEPVRGSAIELDRLVGGLTRGRNLIVQGKPMRVRVTVDALILSTEDGSAWVQLLRGESLQVLAAPVSSTWRLRNRNGFEGIVTPADPAALELVPSEPEDSVIAEPAVLDRAEPDAAQAHVTLHLAAELSHLYDRTTVSVLANVAPATHGETRREVLGGGDAARPFQRFRLRQKPLTYTAAPVAGGGASSLELRVNGVLWHEAPDLFQLGPRDRKYVLRHDDESNTTVQFGDGRHGARLPSGVENVEAVYRTGIGLAGLVDAERIALLAIRPLGVKSVTNPVPATGGADPETRDQARRNAPITVLTLDRIVALSDFEDFARSFSGIGKAQARLLWEHGKRLVHLTLAGLGGRPVDPGSALFKNLRTAMDRLRDPFQTLRIESFDPLRFAVAARVRVDPDHLPETVLKRVQVALTDAFSAEARELGQSVFLSDVMAVIQRVEGVIYVDVEALHLETKEATREDRILALPARLDARGTVQRAQLLTLTPRPALLETIA